MRSTFSIHYLLPLLLILALSVIVRLLATIVIQQPGVVQVYAELADGIRAGRGYVQVSDNYPVQYTMPGYTYLRVAGLASLPWLLDAIFGPLLIWMTLRRMNYGRSAIIAAIGYALAIPIAIAAKWQLPDSLTVLLCLCAVCPILIWQDQRGAIASGAALGLAGWFRGDNLLLVPLLALVIIVIANWRAMLLFVGAWLVPTIALGLFWLSVTGVFSLTRPGTGLLLWQGLGQTENPWGIEARDEASIALLTANNLQYGTSAGDSFLLREYIAHATQSPGVIAQQIAERFQRVLLLIGTPWGNFFIEQLAAPLLFICTVFGFYANRHSPIVWVFLALWLSRVVPFSIMRDEPRFVLPVLVVYIVGTSILFEPRRLKSTARPKSRDAVSSSAA